jgi:hypothetical protein
MEGNAHERVCRVVPIAGALALTATLAIALASERAAALELVTDPNPVVIELYTSQGCSSCPPADDYLGELAQRRDVLPLAFHVDYWNYIGWQDPFSSPDATNRQREYGRFMNLHAIYTPQMVIDGATHEVGSDRGAVASAIKSAARGMKVPVTLLNDENGFRVRIGEGEPGMNARVWLIEYDPEAVTEVQRGENAGKTLVEYNIVRAWRAIGNWDGTATEIALPRAETDASACAVIVQADPIGPIYGAAAFRME